METLKKIQLSLLIVGCIMMGPSISIAQQVLGNQTGVAKYSDPSVSEAHPKSDIDDNLGDFPPPYFTAGKDATICTGDAHMLEGVNSTSAVAIWETTGDGEFDNAYSLNAVYFPGEMDKSEGQVMLNLVLLVPGDTFPYKYSDSMILILNNSCDEPYSSPQR